MCGRYHNHVKYLKSWSEILGNWPDGLATGSDVAPTMQVPVVTRMDNSSQTLAMRWGLTPRWSKQLKTKYSTFNARCETVGQKPAFRAAFKQRNTCLLPAQGYYEWSTVNGSKLKHFIQHADESPLVMAGIWELWEGVDTAIYTCTILTRPATAELEHIHPRMPVILNKAQSTQWLEPSNALADQLNFLAQTQSFALAVS